MFSCVLNSASFEPCDRDSFDGYKYECFDNIAEPMNKRAIIVPIMLWEGREQEYYRSGVSSLLWLRSSQLRTACFHIPFLKPNPFYEVVNKKLNQMSSSGLLEYWHDNEWNSKGFKYKADEIGPQVLTMDHLGICFVLWLITLSVSFVAFLGELIWFWWPMWIESFKETLTAWFLIRSFMSVRQRNNN